MSAKRVSSIAKNCYQLYKNIVAVIFYI